MNEQKKFAMKFLGVMGSLLVIMCLSLIFNQYSLRDEWRKASRRVQEKNEFRQKSLEDARLHLALIKKVRKGLLRHLITIQNQIRWVEKFASRAGISHKEYEAVFGVSFKKLQSWGIPPEKLIRLRVLKKSFGKRK